MSTRSVVFPDEVMRFFSHIAKMDVLRKCIYVDEVLLWTGFAHESPHICGTVEFPDGQLAVLEKEAICEMIWWMVSLIAPDGTISALSCCRSDSPTGSWTFADDPYHIVEVSLKLD